MSTTSAAAGARVDGSLAVGGLAHDLRSGRSPGTSAGPRARTGGRTMRRRSSRARRSWLGGGCGLQRELHEDPVPPGGLPNKAAAGARGPLLHVAQARAVRMIIRRAENPGRVADRQLDVGASA